MQRFANIQQIFREYCFMQKNLSGKLYFFWFFLSESFWITAKKVGCRFDRWPQFYRVCFVKFNDISFGFFTGSHYPIGIFAGISGFFCVYFYINGRILIWYISGNISYGYYWFDVCFTHSQRDFYDLDRDKHLSDHELSHLLSILFSTNFSTIDAIIDRVVFHADTYGQEWRVARV